MSAYHVYRFAEFLVRWLPEPIARRLSSAVGRLLCHLQRRNRAILYRNLEVAFGAEKSPAELRELRSAIFGNFGRFVYEFVHLPHVTSDNIADVFTPESHDAARRLGEMAESGPVISIAAHLGHWELGAAAVGLAGYPIAALVDSHPNPHVTEFFDDVRRSRGIHPIPVTAFHRLFRCLKDGSLVAIVADRAVTGQGIAMTYFGHKFLAPDGYAVMARRFGAKVVPTFCLMQEDGRYHLFLEDPIEVTITDDAEADIRDCVERCLAVIEKQVRNCPDQWYAFRRIWGTAGADRMLARKKRARLWKERADALAREAVTESHRLRERDGDRRPGRDS